MILTLRERISAGENFCIKFCFLFHILQELNFVREIVRCVSREQASANVVLKKKRKKTYELQQFMRNLSFYISKVSKSEFISLSIWNYLKLRRRVFSLLNFWRHFLPNFLYPLRKFAKFSRLITRKLKVI